MDKARLAAKMPAVADWRRREGERRDAVHAGKQLLAAGASVNALLPAVWRPDLAGLLPPDAAAFHGPALAIWLTGFLLLVVTARSLVHVFAPDGGAHSVATIDISVAGGRNIVAVFGQWGAIQLLLAGLLWALLLRYPGLTPLILCVLMLEPFLRELSIQLKPLETVGVAPGRRYNWLALLPVGLTLYLALCPTRV